MGRANKRQRLNGDTGGEDLDNSRSAQLRQLVGSVLEVLGLDVELLSAQLLRVRQAEAAGVGVFSSDLAVRLFHSHSVRRSDSTGESFASTAEVAVFCVRVMKRSLQYEPETYNSITDVSLPDEGVVAQGIHADRLLIRTREFAIERSQRTTLETRIEVLYRDSAIIVVNKPHNMLSVDGNQPHKLSVQTLLREYYPASRMVHRLDYETSGILVVALTRTASQSLNRQFRDRAIDKTYVARVFGRVVQGAGSIELRMAPSKTEKLVQRVVEDDTDVGDGDGAWSRTEWRVLDRGEEGKEGSSTLVELKPVTGKTHQLRVHMDHIGHPILGDSLYSPERVVALAPRLLLHAAKIRFSHPDTNEVVTIESRCDFQ